MALFYAAIIIIIIIITQCISSSFFSACFSAQRSIGVSVITIFTFFTGVDLFHMQIWLAQKSSKIN